VSTEIDRLVALSRLLGDPARNLAILGEGNTSIRTGDGRMLVKASGASLRAAVEDDFVDVDPSELLAILDDPDADDTTGARAFAQIEARTGRRPP
jgi:rhamnose utilization protein RhaD (predicted bifunctional aldolase and dehydrogenase)